MTMTEARIQEIAARVNAATRGPWVAANYNTDCVETVEEMDLDGEGDRAVFIPYDEADAEFIAHARQDIPDLIAALLEEQVRRH